MIDRYTFNALVALLAVPERAWVNK